MRKTRVLRVKYIHNGMATLVYVDIYACVLCLYVSTIVSLRERKNNRTFFNNRQTLHIQHSTVAYPVHSVYKAKGQLESAGINAEMLTNLTHNFSNMDKSTGWRECRIRPDKDG